MRLKSVWISVLVLTMIVVAVMAMGAITQTKVQAYGIMRADGNDTTSTVVTLTTGGEWDQRPSDVKEIPDLSATGDTSANGLVFIFAGGTEAGTTANNKTFSWKLYAWKDKQCPAEMVAYGTGVFGTQDVYRWPDGTLCSASRNWADTIVITAQRFPTTLTTTGATGFDEIAKLVVVDAFGYRYWHFDITDADGETGTEANAVSIWWSYL